MLCCLITACGDDAPTNVEVSAKDKASVEKTLTGQKWTGASKGYVSVGDPASDRVELFVRLGHLLAAASVYRVRADHFSSVREPSEVAVEAAHANISAIFNAEIMQSYKEIEPLIQNKAVTSKQDFGFGEVLIELVKEQQVSDLINGDRAKRDQQFAANQKIHKLTGRIRSAVMAFFPSRHEFLLASSALAREAGDKVALAVSAEGVILDIELLEEASALIDRSIKLDPKNITYCDSQRNAIKAYKHARNELLDSMVPIELGAKLDVTASDVYSFAEQAQVSGESFPVKDSNQCE